MVQLLVGVYIKSQAKNKLYVVLNFVIDTIHIPISTFFWCGQFWNYQYILHVFYMVFYEKCMNRKSIT